MKLSVTVPATTANLGPGFDCLGLALDWWNTITVEPAAKLEVRLRGDSEGLPADASNMTIENMLLLFKHVGKPMPPVCVTMTNRIPISPNTRGTCLTFSGKSVSLRSFGIPSSKVLKENATAGTDLAICRARTHQAICSGVNSLL